MDHTRTKANSPQTNGICERLHRTIKDEFYDIAFRKKLYRSLEELQVDLDAWLAKYTEQRPHSGRHCTGKTPLQTFRETVHIAVEKTIKTHDRSDNAQHILSAASRGVRQIKSEFYILAQTAISPKIFDDGQVRGTRASGADRVPRRSATFSPAPKRIDNMSTRDQS